MKRLIRVMGVLLVFVMSTTEIFAASGGGGGKSFSLGENLDIEPTTGTSSLNIPIEVAQGRAGIQPSVSLLYNSSGSNGLFGMGWGMELGSVQRSNRRGVPKYTNADQFVITQPGSQQDLVDISGNATEFKPELEGSFSRIKFDGTSWIVTDGKGTKYYFGSSPASRVYDPNNTARVYRWALDRVEDLNGNYLTVTYTREDNQLYATQIDYTGNTQLSLPTFACVKFNYEARTVAADMSKSYSAGFLLGMSRRMKSIDSYVGTNLVRRYQMNYSSETETGRSLLQGVKLIGSDGVSSLPSTVLTYSQGQTSMDAGVSVSGAPTAYDLGASKLIRMIDMNSDGRADILKTSSNLYTIYYNTSSGGTVSFGPGVFAQNSPTWAADNLNTRFVDMNGDGLIDVVTGTISQYTIWINNGVNGFNPPVNATNFPAQELSNQNLVQFIDLNNDGKLDIVRTSASAGGVWSFYYNTTGSDFAPAQTLSNYPDKGTNVTTMQFADFNGDGLTDAILGDLPKYKIWINNGSNGFNAPFMVTNNPTVALNDPQVQMADVNGDGLTDLLQTANGSYKVYSNNGNGDFLAPVVLAGSPTYGTANAFVKLIDLNDDGKVDVVAGDPTNGKPYQVWLNDGMSGFKAPVNLGNNPNVSLDNENVMLVDLNGDNRLDLLQGAAGAYTAWLNKRDSRCAKSGTLIDVDNSVGGHLEMQYQHLPVTNLSGTSYKIAVSPFRFNSVKTISRRASLNGDLYATTYAYTGGLWNVINREFRGFKTVKVSDADGNYSTSEFNQDDIFKGRPINQATYDASGNLFNKTVNIWNSQTLYPGVVFPYLKRVDSYVYDGNATGRRTAQEFFYDASPQYGNVTKTISFGEVDLATGNDIGTDVTTTEVDYNNNTTAYLIGIPKVTTIKDSTGTVFARTWFYYDNATDVNTMPTKAWLTKKMDWAGDAVGTVHPFTLYTYDTIGNLLTTEDSKASRTTIAYDATYKMFPVTTTNAMNHVVTNEYYGVNGVALSGTDGTFGLWGQLKSTTDPNSQKGIKIYDTFGRVSKTVGPNDTVSLPTSSMEYVYGVSQLKVISHSRIQSGKSGTIDQVQFYDGLNRLVQTKSKSEVPGQFIVSGQTQYNSRGLPVKKYVSYFTNTPLTELNTMDTTQAAATITYDAMGRVTRSTSPDGSYANGTYDDWTSVGYDENGHMQKSYFDAFGRLIKKEEYLGADGRNSNYPVKAYTLYATTQYFYDAKGNLIKTQDTKGNITTIQYDTLGRKVAMTDPDMGTWTYGYDVEGNLLWQQDAKGQRINFTYDAINRLKQKTDLSVLTVDYTYDDPAKVNTKGRLTKAGYGGGKAEFEYDNLGRELNSIKTIGTSSYQVGRTYDGLDRLVTLQYPDSSKVGYTYNDAGQVNSVFEVLPTTVMPSPTGIDAVVLASPAAQYRLNENDATTTVMDFGSAKTNGVASTTTASLSKVAKINNGFWFNGTSSYVNLNTLAAKIKNDTTGSFTFWVKPEAGTSIINFVAPVGGFLSIEWHEFNQAINFSASGPSWPGQGFTASTPKGSVPFGAWAHIAVIQDGTEAKIYINGQLQPLSYSFANNKGAWLGSAVPSNGRIGAWNGSTDQNANNAFFKGTLDDIRYYSNKVLIPQEVWAIYNNYSGTEAENPQVTNNPPANITLVPYLTSAFAQFKLNDNAASTTVFDESVNYNDGMANVNTSALTSAGKINGAFNFTGTQAVKLDNLLTDIKTDSIGTISLWVKPVNDTGSILSFSGAGGSFSIDWYKSNQSANFAISGAGTPISCTTQAGSLPANVYSHLVIVQDGIQFKIYINGVQQSISSWYNSNPGAWISFLTGALTNNRLGSTVWQGTEYFFQGGVDDFRYYKKALNQTEVLALYNNGNGTEEANPAIGTDPTPLPPLESSTVPSTAGQVYVKNVDYNSKGQITKLEYGNGVTTTYTYDPNSLRLSNLKTINNSGTIIQNFTYTYDGVGNIMSITDSANTATQSFKYDELNRLTQATGTMYGTKTYTFDEIGNIITKDGVTYTYGNSGGACPPMLCGGGPHAVTSLSDGTTITYDLNGNMIRKSMPGTVMEYSFDKENRLIEVKKNTSTVAQFLYDGDGGRVQKVSYVSTVNTVSGGVSFGTLSTTQTITTTPVTTKYIGEMYEETGSVGTKSIYFGSQKVAMVDTNNSSPIFLHSDHLGSTNVTTNASGVVQELIEYEPFGKIQTHKGASGNNRLAKQQFTGKKLDDETGLYYFNARYYDPQLGKFITPDTIVQAPSNPQTLNRYTYCNNNPINLVDPSGHKWSWKKFWKAAIGIVVGIVATLALGPGGLLAWYGSTMAGIVGGALGGAISGGLNGGWKGALIGGAIGGVLGGLGGKFFGGSDGGGGTQLADASVDLGTIHVVKDAGGSALGDAVGNIGGNTASTVLRSAISSAAGGVAGTIAGAAASAAAAVSSAGNFWAYQSVVPGPFGQPVSQWQNGAPTGWGDPVGYTEGAGGGWMWTERAALSVSVAATAGAGCAMLFDAGASTIVYSGQGSVQAALNAAENGLGRTILNTPGGRMLNWVEQFTGQRLPTGVWKGASNVFVRNAKGVVRAFLNNPRAQSVYKTVEEGILNGRGIPIETYGPLSW